MTAAIPIAGFVNSHSHAFQRALRGRAAGTDFWTWREGMLEEADRATPDSVRDHYSTVYREMRAAGYTAVGEFHYLGAAAAFAAADAGCLSERTTIIHATHANDEELDLLAANGARICACPTTESDLGDGFLRVTDVLDRSIPLCIGSDSNMRIDPLEELRELEGIARRQTGRRGILTTAQLLQIGSAEGARALQLEEWATIEIDPDHRSLAGVAPEHVEAALIAGCTADVVVSRGG